MIGWIYDKVTNLLGLQKKSIVSLENSVKNREKVENSKNYFWNLDFFQKNSPTSILATYCADLSSRSSQIEQSLEQHQWNCKGLC